MHDDLRALVEAAADLDLHAVAAAHRDLAELRDAVLGDEPTCACITPLPCKSREVAAKKRVP